MKCRPMNRSGRSVTEARRVMEIEDVLDARRAVGFQVLTDRSENLLLDLFVLGGRFDDDIAGRQGRQIQRRADARQGLIHRALLDHALGHLPGEIAADGLKTSFDPVGADVMEQDRVAGRRADMGDPSAHLTGPDHADDLDIRHRFSAFAAWPPVRRVRLSARISERLFSTTRRAAGEGAYCSAAQIVARRPHLRHGRCDAPRGDDGAGVFRGRGRISARASS